MSENKKTVSFPMAIITLLIVLYTIFFGKRMFLMIYCFVFLEGFLYGFGMWWFAYLYIWLFLAVLTYLFQKMDSRLGWGLLCGFYGLLFGTLSSIPYFVLSGFKVGIAYIAAGIPFDLIHAVSNFLLAFLLLPVLRKLLDKLTKALQLGTQI